jgi:glycosyltransferase involved in cell wall biosynthesis
MDKPIRVAQVMGKLWAGGVEMVVFNYCRAIDKSKVQFDFYYDADSTVEPPQDLIDMGARFIKIPPYQKLPVYLSMLKKHFTENKYTIVHSHINTLSVFPLYMAWKCGIPMRIAHNHSVPGGESLKRTGLKYSLRTFSRVFPTDYFACSEKAGRWLFGDKNYENGKVIVIKNAVDFDRFRASEEVLAPLRKALGLEGKFVIGHVGRFTFAKNHKFLIDIFEKILELRSDVVLMLLGDGEMNGQIHSWVADSGVSEKVIFVGQVTEPEKYYRLANVMVIPSVFEGLSLTTIESQIAGTPVVVSTAIPEEAVISDGCVRLNLDDDSWAETVMEYANKKVILDDRSDAYEINTASRLLEKLYLRKVGGKHA